MAFNNFSKLYILANLKAEKSKIFTNMRQELGSNDKSAPHITLFEIIFNADHPLFSNFKDDILRNYVQRLPLPDISMTIASFEIKGKDKKFFTAILNIVREGSENEISKYRKRIYEAIDEILYYKATKSATRSDDFVFYQSNGIDIYAIPSYNYGVGVWTPHVSITNDVTSTLKISNYLKNNDVQSILNNCMVCLNSFDYGINIRRDCDVKFSFDPRKIQSKPPSLSSSQLPYVPTVTPYIQQQQLPQSYQNNNLTKSCESCKHRFVNLSSNQNNKFCCIRCRDTSRAMPNIKKECLAVTSKYHNDMCNANNESCNNTSSVFDACKCFSNLEQNGGKLANNDKYYLKYKKYKKKYLLLK